MTKESPNLIIASNRLPYTLSLRQGQWQFAPSSGGLVTALAGLKATQPFHWIGWPGREVPKNKQAQFFQEFQSRYDCTPVYMAQHEIRMAYNGFCNQVIWPLFHYLPNHMNYQEDYWRAYQHMNHQFAEVIAETAGQGDQIWIHDFHLMLVPDLLRRKRPDLTIGFFLHIPFPSSEVYRLLAVRQEILRGLLGADLIGFHTYDYMRHFNSACLRLLGLEAEPSVIALEGRRVRLGVFPIGIDPQRFETALQSKACQTRMKRLRRLAAGRKIILSVDRMDYTKGIPLKLEAFERFLKKYPDHRSQVLLYQVAVPSREDVTAYRELKDEVNEWVGRINGQYGILETTPIYYLNKSVRFEHLCALYATADIVLLTPIRDGMNLVAQEYVLCHGPADGVLILSEFAGSAHSLSGCILVNPWNTEEVADSLEQALSMHKKEQQRRNEPMYHFIKANTAERWGKFFVNELAAQERLAKQKSRKEGISLQLVRNDLIGAYFNAKRRQLFLDYDGTLTPIRSTPAEVFPDDSVLHLLEQLAADSANEVHIVSGRDQKELEGWFDHLPIHMCAEHGFFHRSPGKDQWQQFEVIDMSWKKEVLKMLEYFRERTPGVIIEDKSSALSWHYRRADPIYGQWQADELLIHLEEVMAQFPVEAVKGHKVIEVRPLGIHKGRYIQHILQDSPHADFIFCAGDDLTDEDMYKALPPDAWSCHIGSPHTGARYYTYSQSSVFELLQDFISLKKRSK